jgi:aerobic carbon-monoxide dehydrogenase small subunit
MDIDITLTINGRQLTRGVEARMLLVHFLREEIGLTGAHVGCNTGQCGCCTVSLNGRPVKSCMVFAVQADGAEIVTIEGLATPDGGMHPLQQAFRECDAVECGFCTPGMIMASHGLVEANAHSTVEEIQDRISGNLCRCTGYRNIVRAVQRAQVLRHGTDDEAALSAPQAGV